MKHIQLHLSKKTIQHQLKSHTIFWLYDTNSMTLLWANDCSCYQTHTQWHTSWQQPPSTSADSSPPTPLYFLWPSPPVDSPLQRRTKWQVWTLTLIQNLTLLLLLILVVPLDGSTTYGLKIKSYCSTPPFLSKSNIK